MKVKFAFWISLFLAEHAFSNSLSDYERQVEEKCVRLFNEFPQLKGRYDTPRVTNKKCRYKPSLSDRKAMLFLYLQNKDVKYKHAFVQLMAIDVFYTDMISGDDYFCSIDEPLTIYFRLMPIDCGPFDIKTCDYRKSAEQGPFLRSSKGYILLDGARIVKKIKRVEKGSMNYNVTLVLSLGNGSYTNLNYMVRGNSLVKGKEDDPFYFSEQDLLRLSRETTFPICIYRAWDSLHSKYYPCKDRLPKEYYWDKRFNRWLPSEEAVPMMGVTPAQLKEREPDYFYNRMWEDETLGSCYRLLCETESDFFPAYTGIGCVHNIDECAFGVHDCPEGRLCHDTNTSFYCECPEGTTGAECKDDIDECDEGLHECPIYSTCANTNGSYICKCPPWLTGKDCSEFINYCKIYEPCQNGGECHAGQNDYTCTCAAGYTGKNCTDNINECASNPCKHGTCIDEVNKYKCACDPKYTGRLCDVDINECEKLKCVNGTCVRLDEAKYKCECFPGYNGELCDIDIDECSDGTPCGRSGTCTNTVGSFTCECENGFTGKRCEKEIYECESSPCRNGGYCLDGVGDYICLCPLGYDGTHCEHLIDHCKENECENGGTCENLPYGYSCVCPSYAKGAFCEDLVDYCKHEDQCGRGYCHSLKGSYECICLEGYTGRNCELTVDPCVGIECRNGGKCTPSDAEVFNCNCPQGTSGKFCEWTSGTSGLEFQWKLLFVASALLAISELLLV